MEPSAVRWRSEQGLRRAVSLLLLEGHDEDARELLLHGGQDDPGAYLAGSLDPEACRAVRAALPGALREEAGRLRTFWSSSANARKQRAMFGPGEEATPAGVEWVLKLGDPGLRDFANKLPKGSCIPLSPTCTSSSRRAPRRLTRSWRWSSRSGSGTAAWRGKAYVQRPPRTRRDYTGV